MSGACSHTICFLINFWQESDYGLQYAIQLAIQYKSRLLLLHVVEEGARAVRSRMVDSIVGFYEISCRNAPVTFLWSPY